MNPEQPAGEIAPSPLTLDARGVALLLGLPFEQQFHTRRRRLEKHGFPRPLPMTPLRWSIHAVEQWIAGNGAAPAAQALMNTRAAANGRHPTVVSLENYRGAEVSRAPSQRGVA